MLFKRHPEGTAGPLAPTRGRWNVQAFSDYSVAAVNKEEVQKFMHQFVASRRRLGHVSYTCKSSTSHGGDQLLLSELMMLDIPEVAHTRVTARSHHFGEV